VLQKDGDLSEASTRTAPQSPDFKAPRSSTYPDIMPEPTRRSTSARARSEKARQGRGGEDVAFRPQGDSACDYTYKVIPKQRDLDRLPAASQDWRKLPDPVGSKPINFPEVLGDADRLGKHVFTTKVRQGCSPRWEPPPGRGTSTLRVTRMGLRTALTAGQLARLHRRGWRDAAVGKEPRRSL